MPNPPPTNQPMPIRFSLASAFYLCLTVFFVWYWTNNQVLANYNLQITGLLVLVYFISRIFLNKKPTDSRDRLSLDITTLTAIILFIVSTTGGLNSSFFFLIYFLLFATALVFETSTTLILTIAVSLFFGSSLNSSRAAIQLSSLLFFSPLAIYFGKQYFGLISSRYQAKKLYRENISMSKDITKEESLILPWLTLNFKNTMIKVVSLTSELLADIGSLKPTQKEKIKEIFEESKGLLASGEKLKDEIDKTTD